MAKPKTRRAALVRRVSKLLTVQRNSTGSIYVTAGLAFLLWSAVRLSPKGIPVCAMDRQRRALLLGAGSVGMEKLFSQGVVWAQAAAPDGYVLGENGGERLIHFRDHGQIFIKAGSRTGAEHLALGTQQVMAGAGIPIHRHLRADEAFYVLSGSGVCTLNDMEHSFEKGGTIFIPRNCWHGFANPDHELLLLWIMSPGGLDGFFRETCTPPGEPPKLLTGEQIREIARKYGTEFR